MLIRKAKWAGGLLGLLLLCAAVVPVEAQRGHTPGPGRMMRHDDGHRADMQLFQALFDHRQEITRQVTKRPDGIETVTESGNPDVTRILQAHVDSMLARVKEERPIHRRDPLFREIFRNADKIEARAERTPKGVRVVETSADAYVVRLLHAHADVVDGFIANGRSEMMKDHQVP